MSSRNLSILEHLREVSVELYSFEQKNTDFIFGLCEKELANLIHQYYQDVKSGGSECDTVKNGGSECVTVKSGGSECDTVKSGGSECDTVVSGGSEFDTIKSGGRVCDTLKSGGSECDTVKSGGIEYDTVKSRGSECDIVQLGGSECDTVKSGGSECDTLKSGGRECDTVKKRQNDDQSSVNKKLKVDDIDKVCCYLSPLELLPNEIYAQILKSLGTASTRNLRLTCKRLFVKTTSLDQVFKNWCFDAFVEDIPDFVIKSEGTFDVHGSFPEDSQVERADNLVNRYAHRISSIKLSYFRDENMLNLRNMKPAEFPNLISIDLKSCKFDNLSLLQLAPQLVSLKLTQVSTEFDLTSVTDNDESFKKLQTLELCFCNIDVSKIMKKCCNSLKVLELTPIEHNHNLVNFCHDLPTLRTVIIVLYSKDMIETVANILSKASHSLSDLTLKIWTRNEYIDMSTLLSQNLILKSLNLGLGKGVININKFINKCPLIQHLGLEKCDEEIKGLVLKDLIKLKLGGCSQKCRSSVLNSSKYSLRNLQITQPPTDKLLSANESYGILKLELLLIVDYLIPETSDVTQIFFPANTKVKIRNSNGCYNSTVIRRIYDYPNV